MSKSDLINDIIKYEVGEMGESEAIRFFSKLVKHDLAFKINGSYGRTVKSLMVNGVLDRNGNILVDLDDSATICPKCKREYEDSQCIQVSDGENACPECYHRFEE